MSTLTHKWHNPWIPKPEHKEEPVHEELVNEHASHQQLHTMKPDVPMLVPNYNKLYDSLRSRDGWRYMAEGYSNGTVTTVAGSAVTVAVKLTLPANTQSPYWSLQQWPGGTMMLLVLRTFSVGPQTATFATAGEIDVIFVDQFGNPTALGIVPNNAFFNSAIIQVMPGQITDTGQQANLGTLSFTLNSGATVGTYSWQLGLGAVYLLPAIKGYNLERIGSDVTNLDHCGCGSH